MKNQLCQKRNRKSFQDQSKRHDRNKELKRDAIVEEQKVFELNFVDRHQVTCYNNKNILIDKQCCILLGKKQVCMEILTTK